MGRPASDLIVRVVVDTDVIFSGLRSAGGASRMVLLAIREGIVTLLANVAIILEYEAVLKRDENRAVLGLSLREVDALLEDISQLAEPVPRGFSHRPAIRDANAEIFLEAAIDGHADALVTFNVSDYVLLDRRNTSLGIPVWRPGELVKRLPWRPAATIPSAFRLH